MIYRSLCFERLIKHFLQNNYDDHAHDRLCDDSRAKSIFDNKVRKIINIFCEEMGQRIFHMEFDHDVVTGRKQHVSQYFRDLSSAVFNYYICEELIYNDIIKTIKQGILPRINELLDDNDVLLRRTLKKEINEFEDIVNYLAICHFWFEKMDFVLGRYDLMAKKFTPCNEIKKVFELSK